MEDLELDVGRRSPYHSRSNGFFDELISVFTSEWRIAAQQGIGNDTFISQHVGKDKTPMTTSRQGSYDPIAGGSRERRNRMIRPWTSKPHL